jgi:hypothetical protein
MNRIYRGAAEVLVWLGPDEAGVASRAVAMIENLAEVFQDQNRMDVFRREHLEELAERDAETWEPLSRLTKLPWVRRTGSQIHSSPHQLMLAVVQTHMDRPRDRYDGASNSVLGRLRLGVLGTPLFRQLYSKPRVPSSSSSVPDLHA